MLAERVEGPVEALLGTVDRTAADVSQRMWMDPVTENPAVGATEVWEFYNTTADAHPMHVHEVAFEVVNRARPGAGRDGRSRCSPCQLAGNAAPPEPWEIGLQGHGHRLSGRGHAHQGQFNTPGQFVWHCHIVEHEDNEMMRPYRIGPEQPGQPA